MQTLQKHGLERFDPAENNERFNPNLHEATFQTKVEGKEDGTVFMTQQKGFTLNGRVVRVCIVLLVLVQVFGAKSFQGGKSRRREEQLMYEASALESLLSLLIASIGSDFITDLYINPLPSLWGI